MKDSELNLLFKCQRQFKNVSKTDFFIFRKTTCVCGRRQFLEKLRCQSTGVRSIKIPAAQAQKKFRLKTQHTDKQGSWDIIEVLIIKVPRMGSIEIQSAFFSLNFQKEIVLLPKQRKNQCCYLSERTFFFKRKFLAGKIL